MRAWPGLAAIGAGIVHLGIAAGSPPLLLAVLALIGAVETGWGVLALARPVPAPRTGLVGAAALVALWLLALLLPAAAHHAGGGGMALPVGPAAGAAVLDLAVVALVALRLRRPGGAEAGVVRALLGTAAAAAVVAGVVVASLAGTSVGGAMRM